MREIKFRAWSKSFGISESFKIGGYPIFRDGTTMPYWNSLAVIEQFTGLHDKNGKEIYEGDIIKNCAGNSNKIIWHDGAFIIGEPDDEPDEIGHYYILLGECSVDQFEVIGNIHEQQS